MIKKILLILYILLSILLTACSSSTNTEGNEQSTVTEENIIEEISEEKTDKSDNEIVVVGKDSEVNNLEDEAIKKGTETTDQQIESGNQVLDGNQTNEDLNKEAYNPLDCIYYHEGNWGCSEVIISPDGTYIEVDSYESNVDKKILYSYETGTYEYAGGVYKMKLSNAKRLYRYEDAPRVQEFSPVMEFEEQYDVDWIIDETRLLNYVCEKLGIDNIAEIR